MRTTIDLPDPLFKEAKATAALQGVPLRQIVEEALRRQLHPQSNESSTKAGGRLKTKNGFLVLETKGRSIIDPTPEQLDDWL